MGGWGNGFGGYGGGFANEAMWPYFYNTQTQNDVNRGFDSLGLSNQLTGIQSAVNSGFGDTALGIAGINQNICQTGGQITSALANGFAQAEISDNARQMANMQQAFNSQTAITAGMNNLAMGLQNCCCENRAATTDLKYTIATEECATRNADSQNTNAILNALNSGIQSIKDQMCQDKIDAKNDEIAQLRQENLYARGQASQIAQNADIINGIYNRLNQCPVGTVPVYGEQPIFTCGNNVGCGCGCGSF